MTGKYTSVLVNDPYTLENLAINTSVTFLTWFKKKYSTEIVESKWIVERFLSQEQFNSADTPDMYRERIRPYLTYISYADLLPYLYYHLFENIEVQMRMNSPADINAFFNSLTIICCELNQKQAFQIRQNKKVQKTSPLKPLKDIEEINTTALFKELYNLEYRDGPI
ncbi:1915_t:CDS:2, partial [Diversispora eburnea]